MLFSPATFDYFQEKLGPRGIPMHTIAVGQTTQPRQLVWAGMQRPTGAKKTE